MQYINNQTLIMSYFAVVPKWRPARLARRAPFLSKPEQNAPSTACEAMEVGDSSEVALSKNKFPVWLGSHRRKKIVERNRKINKQKKKEEKKALRRKR